MHPSLWMNLLGSIVYVLAAWSVYSWMPPAVDLQHGAGTMSALGVMLLYQKIENIGSKAVLPTLVTWITFGTGAIMYFVGSAPGTPPAASPEMVGLLFGSLAFICAAVTAFVAMGESKKTYLSLFFGLIPVFGAVFAATYAWNAFLEKAAKRFERNAHLRKGLPLRPRHH